MHSPTARKRIDPTMRQRAQILRRAATPAERKLWRALDALKAEGIHFRRQQVLAGYIVDFVCHACHLAFEVDGYSHDVKMEYDVQRTARIYAEGYDLIRFSNQEVLTSAEAVCRQIKAEILSRQPPPNPPHKGEG